ncbi:hypothetical protein K7472_15320 [Streptomyces sp. PTM05]|uniref:DUF308 domain-containing protein n=1 Tax=Streptantibioticus parmotrematis TaxID=2873249 RepID=A0ABS7QSQ7_9ACTN|nr:hypothetical protein [Streptantibioticus parmotrematis]MBY8886222.1 hypothetical protein [Streptantibioticus parmotrematis]
MAERDGSPPQDGTGGDGLDEEAVWARIVAAYEDGPEDGQPSWPEAENVPEDDGGDDDGDARDSSLPVNDGIPVIPRAFVVRASTPGPRDYGVDDGSSGDEGHFVPPEPPPLPQADVTTKFAWLAVVGGPVLLVLYVLLQEPVPWWAMVVGVGGFLGGFGTLVARMRDRDEEDDDPHGGAVV